MGTTSTLLTDGGRGRIMSVRGCCGEDLAWMLVAALVAPTDSSPRTWCQLQLRQTRSSIMTPERTVDNFPMMAISSFRAHKTSKFECMIHQMLTSGTTTRL